MNLLLKPRVALGLVLLLAALGREARADIYDQASPTPSPTQAASPAVEAVAPKPTVKSYYVERRSYGTQRETEPPRYVRKLSQTGIEAVRDIDWFDIGLEHRTRFEVRDNDFRRNTSKLDLPFLLRHRLYFGVNKVLDPFRFYVEFQDSRRENSRFARDERDNNEVEPIQAVGELYFRDALGADRPLRLQGGRFAFEYTDRRLIARNEWRNTTNTFQGFRAILGQQNNDWQVDILAMQPLQRFLSSPDRPRTDQWLVAVIGDWRAWSDIITLQPYYLGLQQNRDHDKSDSVNRSINSAALRGYGTFGRSGFDYDFDVVYQRGKNGTQQHRAFGLTAELGKSWDHPWKPRASVMYGYGSGDRDPKDGTNQRFERYYGFARPWSNDDYYQWENISAPKLRFELMPTTAWRFDFGYNWYWLASSQDRWNNANLRDPTGRSGDFMGQEFDFRSRYRLFPRVDTNIGYAHFIPGGFTRKLSRSQDSNFFYVEVSIWAFE